MKALLLAGGFGTRLRPLTLTRPKPMLPVCNRPHIAHVLDLLLRHGVHEAVLLTSYLAETFDYLAEEAAAGGVNLEVSQEKEPLGTAGALKHAAAFVGDETFLVFNGDVLTDADVGGLVDFHRGNGAEATILLTPVDDPSIYGVVPTDGTGRVTAFVEKPPPGEAPTNLINAGVYVLEPSVLERIPAGEPWSIERATFPELVADGAPLYALASESYWIDIGTPEKYLQANLDALHGRVGLLGTPNDDSRVAADARVSFSCLGHGVTVEPGARVTDSVLLPGVTVGEGAEVTRSVLGEGVKVAPGAAVEGRTAGDYDTVEG
ncbi:MAG: NDP-sugar synthase [Actinomycetota bacterium]|nr:NDP-sugar synthase [Actinomycetota bacterium]